MDNLLKIGEFSHINNISIQTLRYYDEINLLKPYKVDKFTNYRYYHINQSALIDTIQYLRQLDFSIEQIKHILTDENPNRILNEIKSHADQLIQEHQKLTQKLKELDLYQQSAQLYIEYNHCPQLTFEYLPKREALTYKLDNNIYQMNDEGYEKSLRAFKNTLVNEQIIPAPFMRIGTIMEQHHFCDKHWYSNTMFIINDQLSPTKKLISHHFPKALYAISYCHSFNEELQSLNHFYQAIKKAGYKITGDYVCEVIYEHPNLTENKRHMFIRLQVPVKKIATD
ncbi:MerR family transcriptional regulator [Aerococcaceae bacterium zg-ZUI334]|uniref:MerR family transcriptional regulator n=1 Tax=Aerococcaceae bacterium zg-252 TaxID=2796928 RepID=UPI001B8EE7DE|nr:MerR family transcriptional regulator [Aerococcaceae bacterium zg-ZUI334]